MSEELIKTDLRSVVYALSDALDLVGIDDVAHGKRVGIMAAQCAKLMGWDEAERSFMFDLGMLHDIGVSSTQTHQHLLLEFDWEDSWKHAERGYELLKDFVPLSRMAVPIRHHHTRWDKLGALMPQSLAAQQADEANLIFLVDRVDTFAAPYYGTNLFDHVDAIRERVKGAAGSYFSPRLVDAFLEASQSEAFWLMLEPQAIQHYLVGQLAHHEQRVMSFDELRQLARIFAEIVDAKSQFTHAHSLGVTKLAGYLAKRMGVSTEGQAKLEIAGLLHDLGKLRVPDEVLDKPGKLDAHERQIMNTHSFQTYQILVNIPGFEDIARLAAYHHEVPDGSGYPFHLHGDSLSLEARILRVADIFQAMAQNRPYRAGLSADQIKDFLEDMVQQGKLDANIVATATADMPAAMKVALN